MIYIFLNAAYILIGYLLYINHIQKKINGEVLKNAVINTAIFDYIKTKLDEYEKEIIELNSKMKKIDESKN